MLSRKHREFVNQYFICNMNATAAYQKLYPESAYDSARANAARLIATDNVKAEIKRRLDEMAMSAEEALARLGEMASASLGDFAKVQVLADLEDHPRARLVKALTSDVYEDKAGKIHYKARIELHDAQSAILNVLKIHGKFTAPGDSEDKPFIVKVVYGERANGQPTPAAQETD